MSKGNTGKVFGYYVNLDEQGEFEAEVRNENDRVIFTLDNLELVHAKILRNKHDLEGLKKYLVAQKIMSLSDELLPSDAFEAALDDSQEHSGRADSGELWRLMENDRGDIDSEDDENIGFLGDPELISDVEETVFADFDDYVDFDGGYMLDRY